jgi:hypothetical protein
MKDIILEGKNLSFTYNEKDPPVIDGVNISLEKGKVVGIKLTISSITMKIAIYRPMPFANFFI